MMIVSMTETQGNLLKSTCLHSKVQLALEVNCKH